MDRIRSTGSDHCRAAKGCRSSVSLRFITGIRDVTELFSITRTVTRRNRRRCDEPATLKYRCTRRRPWIIPRWDQFCTGLESISGLLVEWWMIGGKGGRRADIFNQRKKTSSKMTDLDRFENANSRDDSSWKGWNNILRLLLTYNGNHAFKFVDRFFAHFETVNSYSDFIEFRFLVGKNLNFYEIFFFFLYFFEFFS